MSQSSFPTLITYLFIPSLWESVPGTATGNFLKYPTGQPNQTLTGTTTATGLITANGGLTMGGSNNITLGDGTVAPTATQIGYIYSQASTNQTISSSSQGTFLTITSLPIGVYIFTGIISAGNGNTGVNMYFYAGATQLIRIDGTGVSGTSFVNASGSYFYRNTTVQNFTLQAQGVVSNITGANIYFQAIRIA